MHGSCFIKQINKDYIVIYLFVPSLASPIALGCINTKPKIDINCPLCSNGIEDLRHFFFLCTALNNIRVDMSRKLEDDLMRNGLEQFWSLFISSNVDC